ncbi:hypothetical protein MLD38_007213 [Melastoma candidum]|uniref:Uncharacterized protein n=1 Tax=Melastoma candidum TaxID=119954 RepID=A0ACB9RPW5_9MYRT|nr:hypothetical protein MLD38_007213 [Melastoma candidum]
MGRAPCCDKANVKKGPWSPEEDAKLKAYIEKHGTGGNWIALPQKVGLRRCGKSCRLRWLNYLRPNIKHGGFTEEEDNIICSLYISIGSRWSIIAAQLPGRTDNDIKNYWNGRLKKRLLGRKRQNNTCRYSSSTSHDFNKVGTDEESQNATLSNSSLERLQLHIQLQTLQNPSSNYYTDPTLRPKMTTPLLSEKLAQSLQLLDENQHNLNSVSSNHLPKTDPGSVSLEYYARSIMAEASHIPEGEENYLGTPRMDDSAVSNNHNRQSFMKRNTGEFGYYNDHEAGNIARDDLMAWWPSDEGGEMKSELGFSWGSTTGNIFPADQGIFGGLGSSGSLCGITQYKS